MGGSRAHLKLLQRQFQRPLGRLAIEESNLPK